MAYCSQAVGCTGFPPRNTENRISSAPTTTTHWSLWGRERQGGTCPLLLDGMDVGLSELPAIRQLLPLMRPQVPGGQSPQHRVELLPFLQMVLLKGQVLPIGILGVLAQGVILWSRSQKCSCHFGGKSLLGSPVGVWRGPSSISGLGVCYSGFLLCVLL